MTLSSDMIMAWLTGLSADPLMLAGALALATLLTEDGALIAGSLMVGSGLASPFLIIVALALGITVGDLALYAVGWTARESRFLRARLPIRRTRKLRLWLDSRKTPVLFFSRFLPGTRLPTYVTFGFLRLPLSHFAIVMTIAATVWVTSMVLFVSQIQRLFSQLHAWVGIGAAAGAAVLCILAAHRLARRFRHRVSIDSAEV